MKAKLLPPDVVRAYSNAVSRYGPDSLEAREVHAKYAGVEGFATFAKALGAIKLSVGGCGITYDPPSPSVQSTQDTAAGSAKKTANNSAVPAGAHGC